MQPCPPRSRYLPASIAAQRGLEAGQRHRETLSPERYAVVPGAQVCALARAGQGGRTACYAEHSPKRKTCPLLSKREVEASHAPGIYMSGKAPYEDDEDAPFETLIIGPYAAGPRDVYVKRVDFEQVFANHAIPENVAVRFFSHDTVIPSIDMLRDFASRHLERVPSEYAQCAANARKCVATLMERRSLLHALRRRCSRDTVVQRDARRFLKNVFYFAMYSRRWAGPGTPYPITAGETRRNVGQHKRISQELAGKYVHVTHGGEVKLREHGDTRADETDSGRAIAMYYAHLRASHAAVFESVASEFLQRHFLLAIRPPTVDNSYWPAEETVWEALFAGERSVAMGTTCTRQVSADLLRSCIMLAPFLYATLPTWMRFEETLDNIQ
jgi:hypothetical protein